MPADKTTAEPSLCVGTATTLDRLWIYTNFDCNLQCSYCVTESSPNAARQALSTNEVMQLVDEAAQLEIRQILITGGEPFLLHDIFDMLACSSARLRTTVLTNASLLHGKRLQRLCAIANDHLTVQVSLDGAKPEHHDPYRGPGTWAKAVDGLRRLLDCGLRVSVSTTRTLANEGHLEELRRFLRDMGVHEGNHLVRPLAKRGFATEGLELSKHNSVPESTVSRFGAYWHPLLAPSNPDMRVSDQILPLSVAMDEIRRELAQGGSDVQRLQFT